MEDEIKRGPGRPPKAELFPVVLLKNYRPVDEFMVEQVEASGKSTWREPEEAERLKVRAGVKIQIAKTEARSIIAKGIAERGDEI